VSPSGAAAETVCEPMIWLPPGLFSTMTFCFHFWLSNSAVTRANASTAPPGGNGTTIRTGRSGNDCA